MEFASAPVEQAGIRYLVCQSVLEGVLEIGVTAGLVEELSRLQDVEAAAERFLRQVSNRLEQRDRHVLADDRGDLQEAFVRWGKPIDTYRQNRLHRCRHLQHLYPPCQPVRAPLPHRAPVSTSIRIV